MNIFDLFRPKWKHSNPYVCKASVKELTDQALLAEIAKTDLVFTVHKTSLENKGVRYDKKYMAGRICSFRNRVLAFLRAS